MNSVILRFFNKHQGDFNDICKYKQEVLDLVSKIKKYIFYIFRPTNNMGYYRYADNTVMPVSCIYKNRKKEISY